MKTTLSIFFLTCLAVTAQTTNAPVVFQDTGAAVSEVANLAARYPWLATVFMVIGFLRTFGKPLMTLVEKFAASTPGSRDDILIQKVEASTGYKLLAFVLDWTTSVKIGPSQTLTPTPAQVNTVMSKSEDVKP